MNRFQPPARIFTFLILVLIAQPVSATGEQAATRFIEYWNSGDSRAAQNEEVFDPAFVERRGEDGLASIMQMVYSDNRDIELHSITINNVDQVQFLATSEMGNWLEVTLDLAPDGRVAGMGIGFTSPPPEHNEKGLTDQQIAARLEQYLDRRNADGEFSGAVALARNNEILFASAYGMADIESGRPNTLDTPINLGSINKLFTGLAITQLAAQGKLAYTDTVGKYLPDYPNTKVRDTVTVHQLLTHTSGLGSYWNDEYERVKNELKSTTDFARLFASEPLDFEPGSEQNYSNSGPVVLGLIIEAITGEAYYEYIRKNIYQPARMAHSDHYTKTETASGKATGYLVPDDGSSDTLISNQEDLGRMGSAAGGGYASVNDLLNFSTALYDGTLIDAENRELMTTFKVPQPGGGGYAYLCLDGRINNRRYVGHNGGAPGINAEFSVFPDLGYTVVVLANTGHQATPVADQIRQWIAYSDQN